MDDVTKEFLIESNENLDLFDKDLVILENNPTDKEVLSEIFRTIHTIKGGSGFLALNKLEAIAHAGENLLSDLRDGKFIITPAITTSLLKTGDAIRRIISHIEEEDNEGNESNAGLIATLAHLRKTTPAVAVELEKEGEQPVAATPQVPVKQKVEAKPKAEVKTQVEEPPIVEVPPHAEATPTVEATSHPAEVKSSTQSKSQVEGGAGSHSVTDSMIRVDVSLLGRLMNLAGELVLARNQIMQTPSEDPTFIAAAQHLDTITTELQAGVMKARMQSIDNIWGKFPRVVRDLAQACQKHVKLDMEGQDTELDRTILEAIKDPMTHLLRNAIDHGVEAPDVRLARGKSAEGRILLRAFHESGRVNIEMSDDGGGLNYQRIKEQAVKRGLITAEKAETMSEHEAALLIFAPGFSTAEAISSISGRGVGMDVVKTNIEKIGGTVDIESRPGFGTTFKIKIPLTLAIIPALIVRCGGDRYAIPQVSLIELVRLNDEVTIEHIHGTPVHRLRGDLLPLVYLNQELKVEAVSKTTIDIVVLQCNSERFGLVVDEVCDTEEIVVKPLSRQLKNVPCFAGATIMGDGTVALILDVFSLAQRSGVLGSLNKHVNDTEAVAARDEDLQTLLLFDMSETQHMAIPLSAVARLEEFPLSSVEHSGDCEVVQYRGKILPLLHIASFIPGSKVESFESDLMQTVVYNENGRSVGLVVGRIHDIIKQHITVESSAKNKWILGSAVILNRVTDLLDVAAILRTRD